jgi:hypothetical protein
MKGDFSRDTFDARNGHVGVLLQQGRLLLDADFNEQGAIERERLRALVRDLVGPHGGPAACLGFGCITSRGEYLDWLSGQGRDVEGAAASLADRVDWSHDFLVTPGRYYVDGAAVENRAITRCSTLTSLADCDSLPEGAASLRLDLEVWERVVTALDDPRLLDPALGGADANARVGLAWRLVLAPALPNPAPRRAPCGDEWRGGLAARTSPVGSETSSPGGYTGPANRLYRIEIHAARGGRDASFKWSRDNGARVRGVEHAMPAGPGDHLTLRLAPARGTPGSDNGIDPGAMVELLPSFDPGPGVQGSLLRIERVSGDGQVVTLDTGGTAVDTRDVRILRRWDQAGGPINVRSDGSWIAIEHGVEIAFDAKTVDRLRAGDYWLVPARTATASIDWPVEHGSEGTWTHPLFRAPNGPWWARATLGVVHRAPGEGAWAFEDRRRRFEPLTGRYCAGEP